MHQITGTISIYLTRTPFLSFLTDGFRGHYVATSGEFAGTFLFLFFAFSGTQVANARNQSTSSPAVAQGSNPCQLLYISLCFGFSLAVNYWIFLGIVGTLQSCGKSLLLGIFTQSKLHQVTLGLALVWAFSWALFS